MSTRFAEAGRWLAARTWSRLAEARDSDRGDVPGWVMVTLMSAAAGGRDLRHSPRTSLTDILNER